MILDFTKPQKKNSTKDHNQMYASDSGIAGTYVPNMNLVDMYKFKAKHIKGDNERIEIRVTRGVQVLITVFKYIIKSSGDWRLSKNDHNTIQFSMNGKLDIRLHEWEEINQAIEEAKEILGL